MTEKYYIVTIRHFVLEQYMCRKITVSQFAVILVSARERGKEREKEKESERRSDALVLGNKMQPFINSTIND
jgi:hypothetical protein